MGLPFSIEPDLESESKHEPGEIGPSLNDIAESRGWIKMEFVVKIRITPADHNPMENLVLSGLL